MTQIQTPEVTSADTRASETSAIVPLNKLRLEALSDGVFAIVMTLLIIEIKVPEPETLTKLLEHSADHAIHVTATELVKGVAHLTPLFISYFVSFAVLAWVWLSHHLLFHYHAKTINRMVVLLNFLFLSFVSLIPFSAHLLGTYYDNTTAIIFYGVNLLLVTATSLIMYKYIWSSKEIENGTMTSRVKKQAEVRMYLTLSFTTLGILFAFLYTPLTYFFYAFPIIFNVIPGLLNLSEKLLRFELK
jgi:uncharacterized membrane protein